MFRVYVSDAFWWTVQVAIPTDTGWDRQPLEVQFKHLSAEAFDAFMDEVRRGRLTDAQVAQRVVLNWRNVVGPDGVTTVPFSIDGLQALCMTVPGAADCLMRDFIDCHARVAQKN